jgi:predicted transport protein
VHFRNSIDLLFIRHKVNKDVHWLLQTRRHKDKTKMETSTLFSEQSRNLLYHFTYIEHMVLPIHIFEVGKHLIKYNMYDRCITKKVANNYVHFRNSIDLLFIRHKVNKDVHWLLQTRRHKDKTKMETSTSVDKTVGNTSVGKYWVNFFKLNVIVTPFFQNNPGIYYIISHI